MRQAAVALTAGLPVGRVVEGGGYHPGALPANGPGVFPGEGVLHEELAPSRKRFGMIC